MSLNKLYHIAYTIILISIAGIASSSVLRMFDLVLEGNMVMAASSFLFISAAVLYLIAYFGIYRLSSHRDWLNAIAVVSILLSVSLYSAAFLVRRYLQKDIEVYAKLAAPIFLLYILIYFYLYLTPVKTEDEPKEE